MKKTLILAVLLGAAAPASAGFFDSLFGKKDEAPAEQNKAVSEPVQEVKSVESSSAEDSGSVVEMAMGIIPVLTQGLGVTNNQAEGGMGALLQMAQKNLSGDEFGSLSQGIPGIEGLLSAAPVLGGKSPAAGGLGGVMSAVSAASGSLGGLGQITQQFEALGLSPDMVLKFAKMAIEYFSGSAEQSTVGENAMDTGALLQKGLSAILG